jgi:ribosomal protein S18 acetylase RimI-like enzyme
MFADTTGLEPGKSPPIAGLAIERIRSPGELDAFARINAENWSPPDPAVLAFYRRSAEDLTCAQSPFRFFLAKLHGAPVAAVEIAVTGDVAGVYSLSTLAAYRGRGIGSAVLAKALREAALEGSTTAVLQATAAGPGLYRRLGFRQFGLIVELKPPRYSVR